jgi:Skp family chaperone for outer membrane proteins
MKSMISALALGLSAIAVTAVATPAAAQRNAAAATRYGVFDAEAAVQRSAAFTTAVQQIQVTYAPQIQARDARATALNTELQPLLTAAQTQAAANPRNETAFNAAVTAYQTRAQAAERELQTLAQPYELAVQYAREQIGMRLRDALQAAATSRSLDLVLVSDAVAYRADTIDVTPAVITELNRLIPNVQIVPPAGYRPGQLQQAAAQQAAAAAAAANPAATPAPAQPQTR